MEIIKSAVKTAVQVTVGLLAVEAVCICGNALLEDGEKAVNFAKKVVASPTPPEPKRGIFGRRKVTR